MSASRVRKIASEATWSSVFVDAAEFPGALEVAGRYEVKAGVASVDVSVFSGDTEVANENWHFKVGKNLVRVGRLGQVPVCAELDGLHRGGDAAIPRQDDDDGRRIEPAKVAHHLETGYTLTKHGSNLSKAQLVRKPIIG